MITGAIVLILMFAVAVCKCGLKVAALAFSIWAAGVGIIIGGVHLECSLVSWCN